MVRTVSRWPRLRHLPVLTLLAVLGVAIAADAQTTGVITGSIKDAQGGVLPGVTLTLRNADTGVTRTGVTGWMHENHILVSEDEARRLLKQASDYLTKETGKRPVGINFPGARPGKASMRLAKEIGLLYDGSMMGGDDAYEINLDGQPSGLIEIPIKWILNDTMYFGQNGALPSPEAMFKIWTDEFDVAYQEGSLPNFTMHPTNGGHRSVMPHFERFIQHIKSKGDVWIASRAEVAAYVKKNVLDASTR